MIVSKTPVRIEIGGGATDVEPYCTDYGGYVVNVTIDNYFRSVINKRDDKVINIFSNDTFTAYNYEKIEDVQFKDGSRDLIEAILYYIQPKVGLDVYIHGEPPKKAGLGASASLSTSFIAGILKLEKKDIDINEIAEKAFNVEDQVLKNTGGRQDQYASVYGGFNELEFLGGSNVKVKGLKVSSSFKRLIEENLLLYYTGEPHVSGNLVSRQVNSYLEEKEKAKKYLDELKNIAFKMRDSILSEDFELFGNLMTDDWDVKTEFNPMLTTDLMRDLNKVVMKNGGIGGRVCGAGGGGCFLWLVNPVSRNKIVKSLENQNGKLVNFKFIDEGLEILNI